MGLSDTDRELIGLGFWKSHTDIAKLRKAVMSTLQDMIDQLSAEDSELKQDAAAVKEALASQKASIDALNAEIAALQNAGVPQSQLDALQGIVNDIQVSHQTIDTALPSISAVGFVVKIAGETFPQAEIRLFEYNAGKPEAQQAHLPLEADWDDLLPDSEIPTGQGNAATPSEASSGADASHSSGTVDSGVTSPPGETPTIG